MSKKLNILLLTAILCMAWSCSKDKSSEVASSNTDLLSMTFGNNSQYPELKNTRFKIDLSGDTGLVYNVDSIAYGTPIDSVVTSFVFGEKILYATFVSDTDTIVLSNSDTLNFTPRPCKLYVVASDYEHSRWYNIYVNVHQVDPDLYVWEERNAGVFAGDADVHAEWMTDHLALFAQDGIGARLYTSADGALWSAPQVPSGLPADANVRQIIYACGQLFYAQDNHVYTSADGLSWDDQSYTSASFTVLNMLFAYNDSAWAVVARTADDSLFLATMVPGGELQMNEQIGALSPDFPVSDFAALSFTGRTMRPRAMVVGGYNRSGHSLNTRWNLEWLTTSSTTGAGKYRMEDFTIEQPSFAPLTGASIIAYDNALLMFGGVDEKASIGEYKILRSVDEGMRWSVPDTTHNALPDTYVARQRQTVVLTPDNRIFLIGGQNRTHTFSDVYMGFKNDINW